MVPPRRLRAKWTRCAATKFRQMRAVFCRAGGLMRPSEAGEGLLLQELKKGPEGVSPSGPRHLLGKLGGSGRPPRQGACYRTHPPAEPLNFINGSPPLRVESPASCGHGTRNRETVPSGGVPPERSNRIRRRRVGKSVSMWRPTRWSAAVLPFYRFVANWEWSLSIEVVLPENRQYHATR